MRNIIAAVVLALSAVNTTVSAANTEVTCLAKAIYHEARGEPVQGRLAVAKVVLNRTKSSKFPNTICGVVYQKHQFSWTKNPGKIKNAKAWAYSVALATKAINQGLPELKEFKALYFHSKAVKPNWKLTKVAKIGNHIFYA